jgi:hypothetical protein
MWNSRDRKGKKPSDLVERPLGYNLGSEEVATDPMAEILNTA